MMPIRKAQQVVAEPAQESAAEPTVEAGPAQEPKAEAEPAQEPTVEAAVNPTEVLAARPQRMTPIPHRHLPEK